MTPADLEGIAGLVGALRALGGEAKELADRISRSARHVDRAEQLVESLRAELTFLQGLADEELGE